MSSKNSFIPPYVAPNLQWYERDGLMTYIDRLAYKRFEENRDSYLSNVNIVNFDIIHDQCRGTPLENSVQYYKTIHTKDLK